jgi:hypothetical protein
MYNKEEDFYKIFYNVILPKIEKETELNEDDINNLYFIKDKKQNENKHYLCIANNIIDNNSLSEIVLKENFIAPEDNNKLSQKQPKAQLNESNGNLFLSKKTTRTKTDQVKFSTIQNEENPIKKKRKKHGKNSIDNKIIKIKSFIFRIIFLFFNQFFKEKNDRLHHICGEQANNRTVNFNKKLMTKKLKEILSDTGDDYNKNLLNDLSKNQEINSYLELNLEDLFNYLRKKINNEKVEANKLFKIIKIKNEILDLYTIYQIELRKRNFDDKKIIEDGIKEDFNELINRRKSKNERRINKKLIKKNK